MSQQHTDPVVALSAAYHAALTAAKLSGSRPHVTAAADTLRALRVDVPHGHEGAVSAALIGAAFPTARECWQAVDHLWRIEVEAQQVQRPAKVGLLERPLRGER